MSDISERDLEGAELYCLTDAKVRICERSWKLPLGGRKTPAQAFENYALQRLFDKTKRRCLRYVDAFAAIRQRIEELR